MVGYPEKASNRWFIFSEKHKYFFVGLLRCVLIGEGAKTRTCVIDFIREIVSLSYGVEMSFYLILHIICYCFFYLGYFIKIKI